jgi:hypothetical protein
MERYSAFKKIGLGIFLLTWLVVLMVPEFRLLSYHQLRDGHPFGREGNSSTNYSPLPWDLRQFLYHNEPRVEIEDLAKQHPNDADVQLRATEEKSQRKNENSHHWDFYSDAAYTTWKKFPLEKWLLALSLRYDIDFLVGYKNAQQPSAAPQIKKQMNERMTQFLARAEEGKKFDFNNCYYNLMRATALFTADRDEEALAELQDGARKPVYNEYVKEEILARTRVLEMGRATLPEEKVTAAFAIAFPHYARFREAQRKAMFYAQQWERKGEHAKALALYGALVRYGVLTRDSSYTFIGALVGMSLQRETWERGKKIIINNNDASAFEERMFEPAARFAANARSHGRSDLARQALSNARLNLELQKHGRAYINQLDNGGFTPRGWSAMRFWWMNVTLVSLLWTAGVMWLATSLILRLWKKESQPVSPVDIASSSLAVICMTAVLLFVAWNTIEAPSLWSMFSDSNEIRSRLFVLWFAQWIPPLLCFMFCISSVKWRNRRQDKIKKIAKPWSTQSWMQMDVAPLLKNAVSVGLVIGTMLAWVVLIQQINNREVLAGSSAIDEMPVTPFGLPITFTLITIAWIVLRQRKSSGHQIDVLRWSRSTLGALIVFASVAHLLVLALSLPARHEMTQQINRMINPGEMALIRAMKSESSAPQ